MKTEGMNSEKLAEIHLKIRDAREALKREYDKKDAELKEQMEVINRELLKVCETTHADSIKTKNGTIMRSISTRIWTSDWEAFRRFVYEHDGFDLMEKRIHQGNMKQFLEEYPELTPTGLNTNSEYKISVRRPK